MKDTRVFLVEGGGGSELVCVDDTVDQMERVGDTGPAGGYYLIRRNLGD